MSDLKSIWFMAAEIPPPAFDFTLWNEDIDLQSYSFDGTDITEVGNASPALTISTADRGTVAPLSNSTVAVGGSDGSNTRRLGKFEFDGDDWNQVGNLFTLPQSFVNVAGLGPDRVGVMFTGSGLRTYDFDGTDWSQTGNVNAAIVGEVCNAVSASKVIVFDNAFDRMDGATFDGTDWTSISKLTNLGFEAGGMCAMTSTRHALFDKDNEILFAFDEGVSSFTQVGNGLAVSVSNFNQFSLCALSENRIVLGNSIDNWLRVYDFDGTDWAQVGNELNPVEVPEWNNLSSGAYLLI